jgi:hypothetical protein
MDENHRNSGEIRGTDLIAPAGACSALDGDDSGGKPPHSKKSPPLAAERHWSARQHFLAGLNADFAALRQDEGAWEAELAERESWNTTIADGLEH